ncbi:MAG: hypothetical protein HYV03_08445 [Deltaproteobacteria bacterium]|nr:hypothetical protein [Deltaproteobacteria bacterium]
MNLSQRTISLGALCAGICLLAQWGLFSGAAIMSAGCGTETTTTVTASANAGDDQDSLIGDTVTLDGRASSGVNSMTWSFTSVPSGSSAALTNASTLQPTFSPDVAGSYVIRLSVNDAASTDSVTVTAKHVLAVISVPSDSAITTRKRFNSTENVVNLQQTGGKLSGEGSRGSIAAYAWTQVSGPGATATDGTTKSTLAFTAPALTAFLATSPSNQYKWQVMPIAREGTKMVFKLNVEDASGNSDSATIDIYVQDNSAEIRTQAGLPNVGVGTTTYLSGPTYKAATETALADWSWTLTPPSGSSVKFADSGAATSTSQFPKFTPDAEGIYTVAYSSSSGATSGTIRINAGKWVGVGTVGGTSATNPQCGACHDGSVQPDRVTGWSGTVHATKFENSMSTYAGLAPEPYLWVFHTVGYDSSASNDGFDDLATTAGFTFPSAGLTWTSFIATYPSVAKLANIQCENCHGPGNQHSGDPTKIAVSASQYGVCGQCHLQEAEWINSGHNMTGYVHGSGAYQSAWITSTGCVRCHSAKGFEQYVNGETLTAVTETGAFPGVTCAACHDPHSATNSRQLREKGNVTMVADNTTVDAGKAAVCYTCHDAFYEYNQTSCDSNSDGNADAKCTTIDQTATQYVRQVHYNPQAPVFEGKGALTDLNGDGTADFSLTENSFHSGATFILATVTGDDTKSTTNDKCVTCHMAAGPAATDAGYRHLGGHAFKLRLDHGIGHLSGEETGEASDTAAAGTTQLTSACTACHTTLTDFNRTARADYDGDGSIEGIQDEVKGLLLALSTKIKAQDTANVKSTSGTTQSGSTITVDALSYAGTCSSFSSTCKAAAGTSSCTNVATGKTRDDYQQCNFLDATATIRRAIWNHNLIARDGSLGVHNAAFTIQVLQKTYTAAGGSAFATDYPSATQR